jgi:hypothetical protein
MPEKRYTKVEEEIIQILDRLEHEEPAPMRPNLRLVSSRPKQRPRRRISLPRLPSRSSRPAWTWLVLSFALALAAYLLRDTAQTVTVLLAIASIIAFSWPLIARLRAGSPTSGPPSTKTWRGKDITFGPPPDESAAKRARRWLDERRGGPRGFR